MGKCAIRVLSLLTFLLFLSSANRLVGQENERWTMELRIAADSDEDATIVEMGRGSNEQNIYKAGELVAKWLAVLESLEADLKKNPKLVTRENVARGLELLVLVNTNDVTESDVRALGLDKNRYGRTALRLWFNDEGSSKIYNQTKNLVRYGKPERYMAEIMDGKVYATPAVRSTVSGSFLISGDIDGALIQDIQRRAIPKLKRFYTSPPPGSITIYPWQIAILPFMFLVVLIGFLPAPGLRASKHPHVWTICGVIVGIMIGAYKLGVIKSYGTAMPNVENWAALTGTTIHINLIWFFIGGIIGAAFGFLIGLGCRFFVRRAIHNIGRFVVKCKSGVA